MNTQQTSDKQARPEPGIAVQTSIKVGGFCPDINEWCNNVRCAGAPDQDKAACFVPCVEWLLQCKANAPSCELECSGAPELDNAACMIGCMEKMGFTF